MPPCRRSGIEALLSANVDTSPSLEDATLLKSLRLQLVLVLHSQRLNGDPIAMGSWAARQHGAAMHREMTQELYMILVAHMSSVSICRALRGSWAMEWTPQLTTRNSRSVRAPKGAAGPATEP